MAESELQLLSFERNRELYERADLPCVGAAVHEGVIHAAVDRDGADGEQRANGEAFEAATVFEDVQVAAVEAEEHEADLGARREADRVHVRDVPGVGVRADPREVARESNDARLDPEDRT